MRRLLLLSCFCIALQAKGQDVPFDVPNPVLEGIPFSVTFQPAEAGGAYAIRAGERLFPVGPREDGRLGSDSVVVATMGGVDVEVVQGAVVLATRRTHAIPGWLSILPPLLAIAIALVFKRVIPALFLGVWFGAFTVAGLSLFGLWKGMLDSFEVYVKGAIVNPDHVSIILFSLMIGGMVGIISKNGGMQGIVKVIVNWANSARKAQLATGALGVAIFFDDYANTLVVGNTMRSVTDRLRVSREKLAYIVDSTAAPVSALALVTTWIGTEVGLIGEAVSKLEHYHEDAYSIFLNSIPYSFYPILAIFFVFAIALTRRDFGPMYHAEYRARTTGQVLGPGARVDEAAADGTEVQPKEGKPHRIINAALPVLVLIGGVLGGLYVTGEGESLREIIGSADSYKALMWASLLGVLTAAGLSLGQRILTMTETIEAWYAGLKSMLFAMIILILAWALSDITEDLHTARYLVHLLGDALNPGLVPALVFILSAATAFATGSSWSTMGILMPLVVPLAWAVLHQNGMDDPAHYSILYSTVACVLAGSVWGDHCSPISDTTILSSMASGCDHIAHVRTQLPYAMSVGVVAVVVGILPTGFGFPAWIALPLAMAVLYFGLRYLGTVDEEPPRHHHA